MKPKQRPYMRFHSRHRQQGLGTLAVGVIILVGITGITLYSARVALFEQQISANDVRAKEAFAHAEQGMDEGVAILNRAKPDFLDWTQWAECQSSDTTLPCGDGNNNVYPANGLNMMAYQDFYQSFDPGASVNASAAPYLDANVTAFAAFDDSSLYKIHYLAASDGAGNIQGVPPLVVVGEGISNDTTGNRFTKVALAFRNLLGTGPDVPIISKTAMTGLGGMSVVANPNAGGSGDDSGVPLTVWTGDKPNDFYECGTSSGDCGFEAAGNFKTCQQFEYMASDATPTGGNGITAPTDHCPDCRCPADLVDLPLSLKDGSNSIQNYDVLEDALESRGGGFPDDLFAYVFGVEEGDWPSIQKIAQDLGQVRTDCDEDNADGDANTSLQDLGANASGIWWVTDCSLGANTTIGTLKNPVLLVAECDISIQSGVFYGVVMQWTPDNNGSGCTTTSLKINGNFLVYGALIIEDDVGTGPDGLPNTADDGDKNNNGISANGGAVVRFIDDVFENLANDPSNQLLFRVPGSWRG